MRSTALSAGPAPAAPYATQAIDRKGRKRRRPSEAAELAPEAAPQGRCVLNGVPSCVRP
jgi:hypothetical protein